MFLLTASHKSAGDLISRYAMQFFSCGTYSVTWSFGPRVGELSAHQSVSNCTDTLGDEHEFHHLSCWPRRRCSGRFVTARFELRRNVAQHGSLNPFGEEDMALTPSTAESAVLRRVETGSGYVDWGAILAGAALAAAVSFALVAFGSSLGLSLTSFADRTSATPGFGVVIAIGLWLMWLQVSAAMSGGYVAGRLRRRISDAERHEVEMRDGMHGLIVWAVGVLLGAVIAAFIATIGTMGAAAVGAGAASNPQAAGMADYYVDRLVRPAPAVTPAEGEAPAAAPPSTDGQNAVTNDTRAEFGRLLVSNRVTSAESADRSYLIQQIMARTGLNQQQATERLDETLVSMKAQADQARRMAVLMGFITVVSLLISAVGAWWAATKGGDHRDNAVDHSRYVTWR
jgi:hypothetical protein